MEKLTQEKLIEINKEIEVVLSKYGVTLQPTMGISIVPVAKEAIKEAEVVSPLSDELTGNKDESITQD